VQANEVYSVTVEERRRSTVSIALRSVARLIGGLMDYGSDPGGPDVSRRTLSPSTA